MGKNRRKRKGKSRPGSRFADHNISPIAQHARQGSVLVPPLARIPNFSLSSWADDHMPEMLWAVLLAGTLERSHYLACFRRVAVVARDWFKPDEPGDPTLPPDNNAGPNVEIACDLTKLSEVSDEEFLRFVRIPLSHPLGYAALRPLLLLESVPGIERWKRVLAVEPTTDDWNTLARAVAGVLDHQSERSTDIRWLKLILPIISGRLFYPESAANRLEELRLFPDKGDMRSVRPSIRAGEMMIRRTPPSTWIRSYWSEAFKKTKCIDPSGDEHYKFTETRIDPDSLFKCRDAVVEHFFSSQTAERVDARLDSVFGLALYGLSLVEEIGMHRIHNRIAGRASLRALVEACITLRYLAKRDEKALWQSYRVYGAGQAKLAFLKAQEVEGDLPTFLDEEALHAIANEDVWQEYLNIDLGHWANSNVRQLAIDCGAKDLYDRFYDWTSGFVHGNWGAVRDTNFVTCHNPLHRLHRIPRQAHRLLNSVDADAVELVNDMIGVMESLYGADPSIPRVQLVAAPVPPTSPAQAG
jgi:hypothetical protein